MGTIRRLLHRLRFGVREGLRAAKEEADSPGRPPPHRESVNPFWADERRPADPAPAQAAPAPDRTAPTLATPKSASAEPVPAATAATAGRPWYLGADDPEGWDETNPGAEPGKKWGDP